MPSTAALIKLSWGRTPGVPLKGGAPARGEGLLRKYRKQCIWILGNRIVAGLYNEECKRSGFIHVMPMEVWHT